MFKLSKNYIASKRANRIAVGSLFFLHGLCFSSWGSRIPNIQEKLALSEAELGAVLLSLPVGLMLSLPVSGWLVSKIGSMKVVLSAIIGYGIALFAIGLADTTFELIINLFFFGMVSNMVNISVNTQAVGVEAMYGRSIMASFHGVWSLAGFTGAAIGTFMIGKNIPPYLHFVIILAILVIIAMISSSFVLKEDVNKNEGQPIFAMPDKSLMVLGVIAFCTMICEGTMFDWSGVYFNKVIKAEGAWIGVGYTAFMSTMAGGRFIADYFTNRFGLKKILQFSGVITATGFLISILFPNIIAGIIGFLLVGAGVSSVVPLVYSAAGKSSKLSPGVALAAVSTIGFLGFLIGPPLVGLVAGVTSLRISFFIIALLGLSTAIVATKAKQIG